MNNWGGLELTANERHWAKWHVRSADRQIKLNFYLAAGIFLLSVGIVLI